MYAGADVEGPLWFWSLAVTLVLSFAPAYLQ